MRVLITFRGLPGCGKGTMIKKLGLEQYKLCADDIRMLIQAPVMTADGGYNISQQNDTDVWDLLFQMLERRMGRGELVVIDACHSKASDFSRYRDLASKYRYRIFCVDMSDIPLETALERNRERAKELPYKFVPEVAIQSMYERMQTQPIPGFVVKIKPEELWDTIGYQPIALDEWKRIHIIGDIHGCHTALQNYLGDMQDDEYYIFSGDYVDRGLENSEVIRFLLRIYSKRNVTLLEGNHERWLRIYASEDGEPIKSRDFLNSTMPELDAANFDKKELRQLARKFAQICYFTYNDKTVIVTHGGIPFIPEQLITVASEQLIKGVGQYSEGKTIAETFLQKMPEGFYQVHGHRNIEGLPVQVNERTFNLEGRVEFGGCLRAVTLTAEGFTTHEVQNSVFRPVTIPTKDFMEVASGSFIDRLRKSKYIVEKQFGNISSFNFDRDCFFDRKWDAQTIKARGLFINTSTGEIVVRSYNKFFNIGEREHLKIENLQSALKFPVTVYKKENGFLGLAGYDSETDQIITTSKSSLQGEFREWFTSQFWGHLIKAYNPNELKNYLKSENVTLVFECIEPENDPHIIEYSEPQLYLLDIVNRTEEFSKREYPEICYTARIYGFKPKEKLAVLNNWQEFYDYYLQISKEDYTLNSSPIEGVVFEDADGFMIKYKTYFYSFWKQFRKVTEKLAKGDQRRMEFFNTEANTVYAWLKAQPPEVLANNIIKLRNMYQTRIA